MKKKIVVIMIAFLVISSLCIYGMKKLGTTRVQMSAIPEETVETIELLFEIDIPDEGEVLYYDCSLNENELGYIYAELAFSAEHYDSVISQINEIYYIEDAGCNVENTFAAYSIDDKFKTTAEEIDVYYSNMGGFHRKMDTKKMDKVPLTIFYDIFTTTVSDGVFRLMFVSEHC